MSINLDYYSLLHEIRSYSDLYDVSIELKRFDTKEERDKFYPHAYIDDNNKRTIVLMHPEGGWSKEQVEEWRAYFYHEMGHFDSRVADDYQLLEDKKLSSASFFAHVLNCFSDYKQEKMGLGDYRGRDITLAHGQALGVRRVLDNVKEHMHTLDGKSDISISMGILYLSTKCREDWQPDCAGLAGQMYDMFPQPMKDRVKQMEAANLETKCDSMRNADDMYKLSKEILKIFERDPDEEEKKAQQQQQQGGGGGETSDGDGGGVEEGGSTSREEEATISWRDLQVFPHDNDEGRVLMHPLTINYDNCDASDGFELASNVTVRDFVKGVGIDDTTIRSEYSVLGRQCSNTLSSKIRKLLLVKTQSITVHGQKKGKLSSKSMYKVPLQSLGAARERVFNKKVFNNDLDTAVTVLVDFSGSMGGDRMKHAIRSAILLNKAISRIGVPVEVLGFTENGSKSAMSIFKTFTSRITDNKLAEYCSRAASSMGCNADGEAILWAYRRLIAQPNRKKLMVVLSDGQPTSNRGMCFQMTKDVIRSIEKSRVASIYGIGIQSDAVSGLYKNNQTINQTEELENALLTVIKNEILR